MLPTWRLICSNFRHKFITISQLIFRRQLKVVTELIYISFCSCNHVFFLLDFLNLVLLSCKFLLLPKYSSAASNAENSQQARQSFPNSVHKIIFCLKPREKTSETYLFDDFILIFFLSIHHFSSYPKLSLKNTASNIFPINIFFTSST